MIGMVLMSCLMLGSGCEEGARYVFISHSLASCDRDDAELRKYPHLNLVERCWCRVDESCDSTGWSICRVGPGVWQVVICINH